MRLEQQGTIAEKFAIDGDLLTIPAGFERCNDPLLHFKMSCGDATLIDLLEEAALPHP